MVDLVTRGPMLVDLAKKKGLVKPSLVVPAFEIRMRLSISCDDLGIGTETDKLVYIGPVRYEMAEQ